MLGLESIDPFIKKLIIIAVLVIASFVFYLYSITKIRTYAAENNLPATKTRSLENILRIIILLSVIFLAMNVAGAIGNIALSTSILGAMLILVSQNFLSSFVSGIYLLVSRPFNYGDRISVGACLGDVVDIGVISTRVKTASNEIVTIPNSTFLTAEIKNYDAGEAEVLVELEDIGVSYSTDLKKARSAVLEVINKYSKENQHLLTEPEPRVGIDRFSDSAINLKVRFYVDDIRVKGGICSDVRERIKDAFDKKGIEIPFPQRVVYMKKEE